MKKQFLAIGLVLLFIFSSVIPISIGYNVKITDILEQSSYHGKTLYVGGNGSDNYSSIYLALKDAEEGDTIFVYNGTYYVGVIDINKSIILIGENKTSTIIVGEVHLIADNISVSKFTILSSGGPNLVGFEIEGYNNIIIRDNIVREHKFGISFWGFSNNNIIEKNVIEYNDKRGITVMQNCNNNIIRDNVIRFHEEDGILLVGQHYNNEVSNNIIENNSDGIDIWSDVEFDKLYNNIIKNNINGIRCFGNEIYYITNCNILGNIIENNINGIYLTSGDNNNFNENHLQNNEIGIYLESGGNMIEKNNFIENKCHAAFITNKIQNQNKWRSNYWNSPQLLPEVITGKIKISYNLVGIPEYFFIKWINFDWHPAKEPYDI